MNNKFSIIIELPELPLHADATEEMFPHLSEALDSVSIDALGRWKVYALGGEPLPDGRIIKVFDRGRYANSIAMRRTGKFAREVFSGLAIAEQVENGFPARDLKRMLLTSRKVRMSKKGKRYLIIPFRHGTPGTLKNPMPRAIYQQAKRLSHSSIIGSRQEWSPNLDRKGKRQRVTRLKYQWGNRLSTEMANNFTGMVKFQNPDRGGSKETQYLTFRVMSEDSSGWLVPPRKGYHVARTVSKEIEPDVRRKLTRAVILDLDERAKRLFLSN